MSVIGPHAEDAIHPFKTLIATFILLSSSFTMVLASEAHKRDERRWAEIWLAVTMICGGLFLLNEAYEFIKTWSEHVRLTNNLFTHGYYTLVGFHGLHVLVGLPWLGVVLMRFCYGVFRQVGRSLWSARQFIGTLSIWSGSWCL